MDPRTRLLTWRDAVAVLAIGAFLTFLNPFGATSHLPVWSRTLYWVALVGIGWCSGVLSGAAIYHFAPRMPPWAARLIATIAAALMVSAALYALEAMVSDPLPLSEWQFVFFPVLGVSVGVSALAWLVDRAFGGAPGAVTHAPPQGAPGVAVRFLERLPAKVRGAIIHAVSAEDHYLRLHTSKGDDLILMRLSDAIGELEGLEGAQTHRSWWVARDAVESVRRDGDRVILVLKGGAAAPVSRPNVKPLRDAGWF